MNAVTVFNPSANLPSFVKKGVMSELAKSLAGSGASGKRVSIKGGVFRLFSEGKEITRIDDRFLDIVMIAAAPKVGRTFYAKAYDENEPAAPDCWSATGDVPDVTSPNKQSATCATCPNNVKGSGQGDSRACRYSQRLALMLANDMEADSDVLQLSLPATSLFGKAEGDNRPLQAYAQYLVAQGVDPSMVVTRMRFDTTAAVPKLFFKAMRWLTEDEFADTSEKAKSPEALAAITMTVFQQDTPAAPAPLALAGRAPVAAAPVAAPAPAPAPAVEQEPAAPAPKPRKPRAAAAPAAPAPAPAEEVEEPVVRKAATPAPAAPASALAAVLGEWDDE